MKQFFAVLFTAVLVVPAFGYNRLTLYYSDGSSALMKRSSVASIPFYLNSLIAPGLQSSASGTAVTVISTGSDPVSAAHGAQAVWNSVATSAARFAVLGTTTSGISSADNQNTIAVGSTASDLSVLNGAVAVTVNTPAGFAVGTTPTGDVTDSDIVLNPAIAFSTDGSTAYDLQAVLTHEFGHTLGLNHSGLLGATMFQYAELTARYLSSDEVSFTSAIYPAAGASFGTIAGKVVASDGSAVQSALVEMIDTANGNALTAFTGTDGSYSVEGPAGSYVIYAEPLTGTSVVEAGNLYLLSTTVVTSNFEPTVLGGTGTPTSVAVTAGATAAVPTLTVAAGNSSLTPPFAGLAAAAGTGGSISVIPDAPLVVPSGQSVDICLIGGGIDGTVTVTALGQGISVQPGSVRVDPTLTFGGSLAGLPLVRLTLNIAAHQAPTLASLIVTKGTNVLAMSGQLILVPPTPVVSGVQDAESARTTIVPGEWVAIYGSNLASSTSIWSGANFVYGNYLPTFLSGVGVQFNGTPAAVYFVSAGQIDVQAPSGLSGSVAVVVTNNGAPSASFKATAVASAPSLFIYPAGGNLYPAAVHLNGTLVGDPAVEPGTSKAQPGETIIFYVNGLVSSQAGTIVGSAVTYANPVTVTVGTATSTASFAGLVAAGEYQLNVAIPTGLAAGNYPISVSVQGQTSPTGVTIPVGN